MMKYPIGIQSFPDIRERGFVYVDKTAFVYRMALMGKFYPQPSAPVRQVPACLHYGGLFLGAERAVQRVSYRAVGNGVEDVSRASFGFECPKLRE